MAVPDYQSLMLPLLKAVDRAEGSVGILDLLPTVAAGLKLSQDDLSQRLSGGQSVLHNRLAWAKHYLTNAGLLESTRRGQFQITAAGKGLLAEDLPTINNKVLSRYPAFTQWLKGASGSREQATPIVSPVEDASTPYERIAQARAEIEASLRSDLLDRVRAMDPGDFEELIIKLLVRMNYGQGREEMARALGGSGDGGVDGVVNQDPLGLDRVYIQAKRYKAGNTVGPNDINSFIGALNVKKANKGLFVTSSSFTKQALEHALASSLHVVLIDGEKLAALMVRHNVGVVVREAVEIKAIDEGYFSE